MVDDDEEEEGLEVSSDEAEAEEDLSSQGQGPSMLKRFSTGRSMLAPNDLQLHMWTTGLILTGERSFRLPGVCLVQLA